MDANGGKERLYVCVGEPVDEDIDRPREMIEKAAPSANLEPVTMKLRSASGELLEARAT